MADISAHDGKAVVVWGEYRAIPMPIKGGEAPGTKLSHGLLLLEDGTEVFLETYNTPQSIRSPDERRHLNHKQVAVHGIVHRLMPVRGQGLMEPSINNIQAIVELPGS